MAMIKKVIVVILLLVLILANVQICYASNFSSVFPYSENNENVTNIDYSQFLYQQVVDNLRNNNYQSVFSRYSHRYVHIKINVSSIKFTIEYSSNASNINTAFTYFQNYLNNYDYNLQVGGSQCKNVVNNLNIQRDMLLFQNRLLLDYSISGTLEYDLMLYNMLLDTDLSLSNDLITLSGFSFVLIPVNFSVGDINYRATTWYNGAIGNFDYNFSFGFDPIINNCNGFLLPSHSIAFMAVDTSSLIGVDFVNDTYTNTINGSTYTGSGLPNSMYFNMSLYDNSNLSFLSVGVHKTSASHTFGFSSSINDNYKIVMKFNIEAPLVYTKSVDIIQGSTNAPTNTPLHLDYYDCEWYELHYQLANAFIFLITELPIVSDITNVVFNVINLIKNSFDVLTQFSNFGILFAFAMFAIVLGLFIKLFMGSD